jgi:hypothetical protein
MIAARIARGALADVQRNPGIAYEDGAFRFSDRRLDVPPFLQPDVRAAVEDADEENYVAIWLTFAPDDQLVETSAVRGAGKLVAKDGDSAVVLFPRKEYAVVETTQGNITLAFNCNELTAGPIRRLKVPRVVLDDNDRSAAVTTELRIVTDRLVKVSDTEITVDEDEFALIMQLLDRDEWKLVSVELGEDNDFDGETDDIIDGIGAIVIVVDDADTHALIAFQTGMTGAIVYEDSDGDTRRAYVSWDGDEISFTARPSIDLTSVEAWKLDSDGEDHERERDIEFDRDGDLEVDGDTLELSKEAVRLWTALIGAGFVVTVFCTGSDDEFDLAHFSKDEPGGVFRGEGAIVIAASDEIVVMAFRPGGGGLLAVEDDDDDLQELPVYHNGKGIVFEKRSGALPLNVTLPLNLTLRGAGWNLQLDFGGQEGK